MRVAFLGLGIMGRPMAANLVKAGHELTAWNRTPGKQVEGARVGATPGAGDEGADPTAALVVVPAGSVTLTPLASASTLPAVATMVVSPSPPTATNDPEPARMTEAIAALRTS